MANEKPLTRADIHREREALKQRLADLDAAERVFDAVSGAAPKSASVGHMALIEDMGSIKSAILRAANTETGAMASEIADYIRMWKPDYPSTNVSPKLSLYRSEGLLDLKFGRWLITDKGKKELDKSKN